jgi:hypothetical protein
MSLIPKEIEAYDLQSRESHRYDAQTNPFIAFSCIRPPVYVDSPEEDGPDYLL